MLHSCRQPIAVAAFSWAISAAAPFTLSAQSRAPWPAATWSVSSPEAQQLAAAPWVTLDSAIRSGRYGNVDRLLIIRNGYAVVNQSYPRDYKAISAGKRSTIGCGAGACDGFVSAPEFNYFAPDVHPFYRGRDVHTLQSVTKSVIATVFGVAMQRGAIRDLQEPMMRRLQQHAPTNPDPRLARATLADLLTMRTGIEWHEQDRPLDATNTTVQLEASADWSRFTLSQPMDADPGTKWAYNSGGSHLIGAVIRQATGESPVDYARKYLFEPIGIRDFHWKIAGGGLPDGEGGLFLSAESLARIGYLYLRGGEWNGTRVLSESFVREATSRLVPSVNQAGWGYGYQWWRVDRDGLEIWAGQGFGGQFLLVVPSADLIAVSFAWNIFGERVPGLLGPLTQAIRASLGR